MTPPQDREARFRDAMKALREKQGLTQTDVARRLRERGLSFHQSTVAKVETGERPIRLDEAYAIADALGSQVGDMARGGAPAAAEWEVKDAYEETMASYERLVNAVVSFEENRGALGDILARLLEDGLVGETSAALYAAPLDATPVDAVTEALTRLEATLAGEMHREANRSTWDSVDAVPERIERYRRLVAGYTEGAPVSDRLNDAES